MTFLVYELKNRFLGKCCLCKVGILLNKEEATYYPHTQYCSVCNEDNYYIQYDTPKKPILVETEK